MGLPSGSCVQTGISGKSTRTPEPQVPRDNSHFPCASCAQRLFGFIALLSARWLYDTKFTFKQKENAFPGPDVLDGHVTVRTLRQQDCSKPS